MSATFYWHDYETFGARPSRDRPVQFAGIRTDLELNVIGKPLVVYHRLPPDSLPQPEACLITGLTPQSTYEQGVCEAHFIREIRSELLTPETCAVGYNSIHFDDEVTRFTLYRNLYDPYEREYKNGNSRWDLIDMMRLAWATRPEGIEWPEDEEGRVSFRLEKLTQANDIQHADAHDALSDVEATLALARLVRHAQPKLFAYLYDLRQERRLLEQLEKFENRPFLHVSGRYPVISDGGIAPVICLGNVPQRSKQFVLYDLRHHPESWLGLSSDALRERRLTPQANYPTDWKRPPIQQIQTNRVPVIAPIGVLPDERAERFGIDWKEIETHRAILLQNPSLCRAMVESFIYPKSESDSSHEEAISAVDVDQNLYQGGFLSAADRRLLDRLITTAPEEWHQTEALLRSTGERKNLLLEERIFRCRARNYPETLTADELARWKSWGRERLTSAAHEVTPYREWNADLLKKLEEEGVTPRDKAILNALVEYGDEVARYWSL